MTRRAAAIACCLVATLAGVATSASAQTRRPVRVMSINLCTDQIVLALLPPYQIISVSALARDPDLSMMATSAAKVGVNHGQAEDVVLQKPDLVIADAFASATTRAMLRRLGYSLIEVPPANDIEGVRAATRLIAAAVGEKVRGDFLISRMDQQIAELRRTKTPPIPVAAWDAEGLSGARGGIYDAILEAASARDVGSHNVNAGVSGSSVEALLAAAPAFLLVEAGDMGPSLREGLARHPAVRRFWEGRTIPFARLAYICGTPFLGDMAISLREQLRAAGARTLRQRGAGKYR